MCVAYEQGSAQRHPTFYAFSYSSHKLNIPFSELALENALLMLYIYYLLDFSIFGGQSSRFSAVSRFLPTPGIWERSSIRGKRVLFTRNAFTVPRNAFIHGVCFREQMRFSKNTLPHSFSEQTRLK
jgi:hypothetical protein